MPTKIGNVVVGANVPVGSDNVQVAGDNPRTHGGAPAPPTGVAVLSWEVTPGVFVPADNIDARSTYDVVGRIGPATYGLGQLIRVAFTTDGGAPAVGQLVWLASSQDDTNTGRGKATATIPPTGMPPTTFPQIFRQNAVPVGTVISSTYGVDGTAIIALSNSFPIGNTPAADVTWSGARLTSLSSANFFDGDGNQAQMKLDIGQTLVVLFTYEALAALTTQDDIISNTNAVPNAGWFLKRNSSTNELVFQWLNATNDGIFAMGAIDAYNIAIITAGADGLGVNTVWTNLNGQAMSAPIASAIPAPAAGWKVRFGGGCPGKNGWAPGGFIAAAMINRTLSTDEMSQMVQSMKISDWVPTNRLVLPNAVFNDAQLLWSINFADWNGVAATVNTIAGGAGTATTLTKQGTPVRSALSDVWKTDVASKWLDTDLPRYDSRAFCRAEMGARIAFTVATKFDVWRTMVSIECDDFDDNDNSAIAVLVNGVSVYSIPLGAGQLDAKAHFFSLNAVDLSVAVAPFHVELVAADSVARIATFRSGGDLAGIVVPSTATFDTAATARRIVVVGDGQTLGGHDQATVGIAPGGGAVTTRMRAAYPGRVTALVNTSYGVARAQDFGNGSMVPYANYIARRLAEGTPATKEILYNFGVIDWFFHFLDPGPFGVAYAALIDAVRGLTGLPAFIAPPPQDSQYPNPSPSGGGHTLQEYVDAVNALTTGRAWLTAVDITGPNAVTYTIIETQVGASQQALADNIQAKLGY